MNPIQRIFHYRQRPIRAVILNGVPWFVAKDVCEELELARQQDSTRYLGADEKRGCLVDTPFGKQRMVAVNEPGVYSLVFKSRKPEAAAFKHWIAHEVIPSIRATGSYQTATAPPQQLSRRDILNLAMQAENECEELREQVAELVPKGEFYDRVTESPSSFSLGETAKLLGYEGLGRNNLIKFLRREGILMGHNIAKQRYIDRGYFELAQRDFTAPDGSTHLQAVTRVREKGIDYIRHRIKERLQMMDLEMLTMLITAPEEREGYLAELEMCAIRRREGHGE